MKMKRLGMNIDVQRDMLLRHKQTGTGKTRYMSGKFVDIPEAKGFAGIHMKLEGIVPGERGFVGSGEILDPVEMRHLYERAEKLYAIRRQRAFRSALRRTSRLSLTPIINEAKAVLLERYGIEVIDPSGLSEQTDMKVMRRLIDKAIERRAGDSAYMPYLMLEVWFIAMATDILHGTRQGDAIVDRFKGRCDDEISGYNDGFFDMLKISLEGCRGRLTIADAEKFVSFIGPLSNRYFGGFFPGALIPIAVSGIDIDRFNTYKIDSLSLFTNYIFQCRFEDAMKLPLPTDSMAKRAAEVVSLGLLNYWEVIGKAELPINYYRSIMRETLFRTLAETIVGNKQ